MPGKEDEIRATKAVRIISMSSDASGQRVAEAVATGDVLVTTFSACVFPIFKVF